MNTNYTKQLNEIMASSTVLVTGGTGFIAQHIIDKLLAKKYVVISTARSEAKYSPLLKSFQKKYPDAALTYEIVADMTKDDAFDEVLKKHPEITYVLHTASPASLGYNLPLKDAYLTPAVNGTLNILKGIKKYAPQVTKVVITSSIVAMVQVGQDLSSTTINNTMWNPITWDQVENESDAYAASKTYAEKAARKFYEDEKPTYTLATVNPPLVVGPQVFDDLVPKELNSSNAMVNMVTQLPPSTEPQTFFPAISIDARDIAEFHVLAIENKKLADQRIAVAASQCIGQKFLNILNDNFPELDGKICKGDYASVDKLEEDLCPKFDFDNTLEMVGGYDFIPLETSVIDLFKQYFAKYGFPSSASYVS